MIEANSRYVSVEQAEYIMDDGRTVLYLRRRFLPLPESLPILVEVTVTEGERLDMIAARILGDPEQFWRIADANGTMNPCELTEVPGRKIRIPIPEVETTR